MTADFTNGLFEFFAALFILNHCRVLFADKQAKGVSKMSTGFFFLWGLWNIFYYPGLGQWWSFAGGLFVVAANCLWLGLMLHYERRRKSP
jgi:hypothetical protein